MRPTWTKLVFLKVYSNTPCTIAKHCESNSRAGVQPLPLQATTHPVILVQVSQLVEAFHKARAEPGKIAVRA